MSTKFDYITKIESWYGCSWLRWTLLHVQLLMSLPLLTLEANFHPLYLGFGLIMVVATPLPCGLTRRGWQQSYQRKAPLGGTVLKIEWKRWLRKVKGCVQGALVEAFIVSLGAQNACAKKLVSTSHADNWFEAL